MKYQKCKSLCGRTLAVTRRNFYQTGKISRITGEVLFHKICKKCYNIPGKKRKFQIKPGTPTDEIHRIKRCDSRFRRYRVAETLKKNGLR